MSSSSFNLIDSLFIDLHLLLKNEIGLFYHQNSHNIQEIT